VRRLRSSGGRVFAESDLLTPTLSLVHVDMEQREKGLTSTATLPRRGWRIDSRREILSR